MSGHTVSASTGTSRDGRLEEFRAACLPRLASHSRNTLHTDAVVTCPGVSRADETRPLPPRHVQPEVSTDVSARPGSASAAAAAPAAATSCPGCGWEADGQLDSPAEAPGVAEEGTAAAGGRAAAVAAAAGADAPVAGDAVGARVDARVADVDADVAVGAGAAAVGASSVRVGLRAAADCAGHAGRAAARRPARRAMCCSSDCETYDCGEPPSPFS